MSNSFKNENKTTQLQTHPEDLKWLETGHTNENQKCNFELAFESWYSKNRRVFNLSIDRLVVKDAAFLANDMGWEFSMLQQVDTVKVNQERHSISITVYKGVGVDHEEFEGKIHQIILENEIWDELKLPEDVSSYIDADGQLKFSRVLTVENFKNMFKKDFHVKRILPNQFKDENDRHVYVNAKLAFKLIIGNSIRERRYCLGELYSEEKMIDFAKAHALSLYQLQQNKSSQRRRRLDL
jgi:hypothetical protein